MPPARRELVTGSISRTSHEFRYVRWGQVRAGSRTFAHLRLLDALLDRHYPGKRGYCRCEPRAQKQTFPSGSPTRGEAWVWHVWNHELGREAASLEV